MRLPAARLVLAAALVGAGLSAPLARAAITDCPSKSDPEDKALCALAEGGTAAQQVEAPLVVPRDTARQAGESALEKAGLCDPTDHAHCLLPFPSDVFTKAAATPTGRQVALSPLAMPRNAANKPIDPTEWNRNDGFSPGSPLLTSVPKVDLGRSGVAGLADIGASLAEDAPIVLIDAATGERHPYWAELDSNPTDGEQPLLIIRPAVNFTDGHRYVVALRHLVTSSGAPIAPNEVFAARRDAAAAKIAAARPEPKPRGKSEGKGNGNAYGHDKDKDKPKHDPRPSPVASDPIFGPLDTYGYDVADLYLAWTFTIASTRNLTERMLHIRDDAFASLRGAAPAFTITGTTNEVDSRIARRVTGTFMVPNYLNTPVNKKEPFLNTDPGLPGTRFLYLPGDDLPDRNGDFEATFTCNIPRSVLSAPTSPDSAVTPGHPVIYGHGLLGGQSEVNSGAQAAMASEHQAVYCATDWYGMATGDVPNVATMLADMSLFPTLADRVQQGMLAQLFLARLLKDPRGFASAAAFRAGTRPVLKTGEVAYDGNSQGGIIGGAVVAVAQDITAGVLGVPAMNYSTLLDRSTDFATYESVFNASYPSEVDREIAFGLIQMLWDRAEANGYAAHIEHNPLPGTPAHRVLLHVAYGDHQVANAAAEVEARTIGAVTNTGFLAPGRHWAVEPGWGITRLSSEPYAGSAFVYWDSGTAMPPMGNVPAVNGPGIAGHDPHSDPRSARQARAQKAEFLWGGGFVDVCGGQPCYAGSLGQG